MSIRTQWIIVAAVVALLGGGTFVAARVLGDELFPVGAGTKTPEWSARTLDGQARAGSAYQGDVVLLNVWATWCVPCRVEMPSLQALHKDFGGKGLKIVAVSVDDPGSEDAIRDFARDYGLTFEILHDPTQRIKKTFQTTGVPETFVIGPEGMIRKKVIGADDWNSEGNRALIAQLIREKAQARRPAPDSSLQRP